jgi:hypothetical protein
VIATGTVTTIAGTLPVRRRRRMATPATTIGRLNTAYGVLVDSNAVLFTDSANNNLRYLDIATSDLQGYAGWVSDALGAYVESTGTNSRFKTPGGVVADGFTPRRNVVYVADTGNNNIRALTLSVCPSGNYRASAFCVKCPGGFLCPTSGGGITVNPAAVSSATFVGSSSASSILSVSSIISGIIYVGMSISGTGLSTNAIISSFGTGTGGTGTYNMNLGATASGAISGTFACDAGTYCNTGATSQSPCPTGSYCPAQSSFPTVCRAGTYNGLSSQTSAAACLPCNAGYTCLPGSTTMTSCPVGSYCPSGTAATQCSAGTYSTGGISATSISACLPCTPGFVCTAGSPSPVQYLMCPTGFSCVGASALPCNPAGACALVNLTAQPSCFWSTSLLAGSGISGSVNSVGSSASFTNPYGLAMDSNSNPDYVYVSDQFATSPFRYIQSTGSVLSYGIIATVVLNNMQTDGARGNTVGGAFFVASYSANTILRKLTNINALFTIAGSGIAGSADGVGGNASFSGPTDVAPDGNGTFVYVVEFDGCRVRRATQVGPSVVSSFVGNGTCAFSDNALGASAAFNNPIAAVFNAPNAFFNNSLFVVDFTAPRVRVVSIIPPFAVTTLAGSGAQNDVDGTGTNAAFFRPRAIAIDPSGATLFVTEANGTTLGNRVRAISLLTLVVTTIGGGAAGYADGGISASRFNDLGGVGVSASGVVYVADMGNRRVRQLTCAMCPAGFTCVTGAQVSCPTGSFCPAGSASPIPCTPGGYCVGGAAAPTLCGAGTYSSATSASSIATCLACTTGFFCAAGSTTATQYAVCPVGFYCAGVAATACYPAAACTEAGLSAQPACYWQATTLAGNGVAATADGAGTNSAIWNPIAIDVETSTSPNNVYVTSIGGDNLRYVTSLGVVSPLGSAAGSISTSSGLNDPFGVRFESTQGNVYIVSTNVHTILQRTGSGVVSTFLGTNAVAGFANGVGTAARFNVPRGFVTDGVNAGYVLEENGCRVRKVEMSTAAVTTLAGNALTLASCGWSDNVVGTSALLSNPRALVLNPSNNMLYVTEWTGRIRTVNTITSAVGTLAGSAVLGSSDGLGTSATFYNLNGIAIDSNTRSTLYVVESSTGGSSRLLGNRVRAIAIATGLVTTLTGSNQGFSDGVLPFLSNPFGITVSSRGVIYLADINNNRIRQLTCSPCPAGYSCSSGSPVACPGGSYCPASSLTPTACALGYYSSPGATNVAQCIACPAGAYCPTGSVTPTLCPINTWSMAIAATSSATCSACATADPGYGCLPGSITSVPSLCAPGFYCLGGLTSEIPCYPSTACSATGLTAQPMCYWRADTIAGSGLLGAVDGTGTSATLGTLPGVDVDSTTTPHTIYVVDQSTLNIRKVTASGSTSTYPADVLSGAIAVRVDAANSVRYIVYNTIHVIYSMGDDGVVSPFLGTYGTASGINSVGTAATFTGPTDIALDNAGNGFIVERTGCRIRKVVLSTATVTTLAGTGTCTSTDNSVGLSASFNTPYNAVWHPVNNVLYVTDSFTPRIRVVNVATSAVSTLAGSGAVSFLDGNGLLASFWSPRGIALDTSPNPTTLYVAESGAAGNRVRSVSLSSPFTVATIAGSSVAGFADGFSANFSNLLNLAVSASGIIYTTEQSSYRLRALSCVPCPAAFQCSSGKPVACATAGTYCPLSTLTPLPCTPGSFCPANSSSPTPCAGGTFSAAASATASTTCAACGAGTFSDAGSTGCTTCPAGAFCPAQSSFQTLCLAGNYNAATGQSLPSACLPCAAGFSCAPGSVSATASPCPAGSYCLVGTPSTPCPAGTFSAGGNASISIAACLPCTAGFFCAAGSPSATQYSYCPSGFFCAGVAANACSPAAACALLALTSQPAACYWSAAPLAGSAMTGSRDGVGTSAAIDSPYGIAVDSGPTPDSVYVSDTTGANFGAKSLRMLPATGTATTTYAATLSAPYGIEVDSARSASPFGVFFIASPSTHSVLKRMASGTVALLAGSGVSGSANGVGGFASFSGPRDVAPDASGTFVYVVEYDGCRVRRATQIGASVVTSFAGNGTCGYADGVAGTSAAFNNPISAVFNAPNIVYPNALFVLDYTTPRVRIVNTLSTAVTTLAGSGLSTNVDGVGTNAAFFSPRGIAIDPTGFILFVTESDGGALGNRVRAINLTTVTVSTIGGSTAGYADGAPASSRFYDLAGVGVSATGVVYAADLGNARVRQLSCTTCPAGFSCSSGSPVTCPAGSFCPFGSLTPTPCTAGGFCLNGTDAPTPCAAGTFSTAIGATTNATCAACAAGFFCSLGSTSATQNVCPAGSYCRAGSGAATPCPAGTFRASSGATLLADCMTCTLGFFCAPGSTTATQYSTCPIGFFCTGGGRSATPCYPAAACTVAGLTAQPACYWQATTLAGSGALSSIDGTGSASTFSAPYGIAIDSSTSLIDIYVTTALGGNVRYVTSTGVVTTLVPGAGSTHTLTTGLGLNFESSRKRIYVVSSNAILMRTDSGLTTVFLGQIGVSGSANGIGTTATFNSPNGFVTDSYAYGYVTEAGGCRIRQVTLSTGQVTTLAGNGSCGFGGDAVGTSAYFSSPRGVVWHPSNVLYVAENFRVRVINVATVAVTTLAGSGVSKSVDGVGTSASFYSCPVGIALDTNTFNTLYVSEINGGSSLHGNRIRAITIATSAVTTVVGANSGYMDGAIPLFSGPGGVVMTNTGILYFADYHNNRIRQLTCSPCPAGFSCSTGSPVLCPGGSYCPASSLTPTACALGYYSSPGSSNATQCVACPAGAYCPAGSSTPTLCPVNRWSMAIAATSSAACTACASAVAGFGCSPGSITSVPSLCAPGYYCVGGLSSVIPCYPATACSASGLMAQPTCYWRADTVAGRGTLGAVDGVGSSATLGSLTGVDVDSTVTPNTIHIVDSSAQKVRTVTALGSTSTFPAMVLSGVNAIHVDAVNNVDYIVYSTHHVIYIMGSNGIVSPYLGTYGTLGATNAVGTSATFNSPTDIALDNAGNGFVVERAGCRIRKVVLSTATVTTLAGTGTCIYADNAVGLSASFNAPYNAVWRSATNVLYVTDSLTPRIRVVNVATSAVSTLAGSGTASYADGNGILASFLSPRGIALDTAPSPTRLYVVESGAAGNRVRSVSLSSPFTVATIAGSSDAGFADGFSANFSSLVNLAVSASGIIYATEESSYRLRALSCVPCPAAFSCSSGQPLACDVAGSFCPLSTLVPLPCPAGSFCPANSTAPTPCAGGTFSAAANATVSATCAACGAGNYSSAGAAACTACPMGAYCPAQSSFQTLCLAGTYNSLASQPSAAACLPCTAGYSCAPGSTSATASTCPAGSYCLAGVPATPCPAGTFSAGGTLSTSIAACLPCTVGFFCAAGASSATQYSFCPAGLYCNGVSAIPCSPATACALLALTYQPACYWNTAPLAGLAMTGSRDGTGTSAAFDSPYGIAVDSVPTPDSVYVSDTTGANFGAKSLRMLPATGTATTTYAATLSAPYGIEVDSARSASPFGVFFIASYGTHSVLKRMASGTVALLAGSGVAGSANGVGGLASFSGPRDVAPDASGTLLYVVDYDGCRVRRATQIGASVVTSFAGNGTCGYADGVAGTSAAFNNPISAVFNAPNIVYPNALFVLDYTTPRVRIVNTLSTAVTTLAGSGLSTNVDGVGTNAAFFSPRGIAIDPTGFILFVTESDGGALGNRVRAINLTTVTVSTIGGSTAGYADGAPASSRFYDLAGVGVSSTGVVYAADLGNSRVRQLSCTTCPAGFSCSTGSPVACPAGSFCPFGSLTPRLCTAGGYCLNGTDAPTPCAAGSFSAAIGATSNATCVACTAGFFCSLGSTSATQNVCPAGSYCRAGSGAATPCPAGTYRATSGATALADCLTCTFGFFCAPGSSTATQYGTCPIGFFCTGGGRSATPCYPAAACTVAGLTAQPACYWQARTHAGSGTAATADGAGTTASFYVPYGISIDTSTSPNNMFVSTSTGGNMRYVTSAGVVTTPLPGAGSTLTTTTGLSSPYFLNFEAIQGNVFIPVYSSNTVVKRSAAGLTNLFLGQNGFAGFANGIGTLATFYSPSGFATDSSGTYGYVTETNGCRVRQVTLSIGAVTTIAGDALSLGSCSFLNSATGTSARFLNPRGIVWHPSNILYVTESFRVRAVNVLTTAVSTLAGSGLSKSTDGVGAAASLHYIRGITLDTSTFTTLYLSEQSGGADLMGNRIRAITIATGLVTTLVGANPGYMDGAIPLFFNPSGIAMTNIGVLMIADASNNRIRQLSCSPCPAGYSCSTGSPVLCPSGSYCPVSSLNPSPCAIGYYSAAGSSLPSHCIACPAGAYCPTNSSSPTFCPANTYSAATAATSNATCLACPSAPSGFGCAPGSSTSTPLPCAIGYYCVGGPASVTPCYPSAACSTMGLTVQPQCYWRASTVAGSASTGTADGFGTTATFGQLYGVDVDSATVPNIIYVSDISNERLRVVTASGSSSTLLFGAASDPYSIRVDRINGGLFFVNNLAHTIHRLDTTGVATLFLGTSSTSGATNGIGTSATFSGPSDIALDNTGAFGFVVERTGCRIRRVILATSMVSTLAGNGVCTFSNNAVGTSASFNAPHSAAWHPSNLLYVTDNLTPRIRVVNVTSSAVSTLAGSGVAAFADGSGTSCSFTDPRGIVIDPFSFTTLYIADGSGQRVRAITLVSPFKVTTIAGGGSGFQNGFTALYSILNNLDMSATGVIYTTEQSSNRLRSLTCVPCPAGLFCSTGKPLTCPAGSYCPLSTMTPLPCPAGSFCPSGSSLPTPCPAGTVSSVINATSSFTCMGPGTSSMSTIFLPFSNALVLAFSPNTAQLYVSQTTTSSPLLAIDAFASNFTVAYSINVATGGNGLQGLCLRVDGGTLAATFDNEGGAEMYRAMTPALVTTASTLGGGAGTVMAACDASSIPLKTYVQFWGDTQTIDVHTEVGVATGLKSVSVTSWSSSYYIHTSYLTGSLFAINSGSTSLYRITASTMVVALTRAYDATWLNARLAWNSVNGQIILGASTATCSIIVGINPCDSRPVLQPRDLRRAPQLARVRPTRDKQRRPFLLPNCDRVHSTVHLHAGHGACSNAATSAMFPLSNVSIGLPFSPGGLSSRTSNAQCTSRRSQRPGLTAHLVIFVARYNATHAVAGRVDLSYDVPARLIL